METYAATSVALVVMKCFTILHRKRLVKAGEIMNFSFHVVEENKYDEVALKTERASSFPP